MAEIKNLTSKSIKEKPQRTRVYMTFWDGVNLGCAIWIGMVLAPALILALIFIALFFLGLLGGILNAFTNISLMTIYYILNVSLL